MKGLLDEIEALHYRVYDDHGMAMNLEGKARGNLHRDLASVRKHLRQAWLELESIIHRAHGASR